MLGFRGGVGGEWRTSEGDFARAAPGRAEGGRRPVWWQRARAGWGHRPSVQGPSLPFWPRLFHASGRFSPFLSSLGCRLLPNACNPPAESKWARECRFPGLFSKTWNPERGPSVRLGPGRTSTAWHSSAAHLQSRPAKGARGGLRGAGGRPARDAVAVAGFHLPAAGRTRGKAREQEAGGGGCGPAGKEGAPQAGGGSAEEGGREEGGSAAGRRREG